MLLSASMSMLTTGEQRELSIAVVAILYNLLSLYSIENSTDVITKLHSTTSPKPHAHILLDNNAQHEGPQESGRLFLHVVKKRHTCICASCIALPKTRRIPGCLTEFVFPGSVE
jgi:hypothetical protein